MKALYRIAMVIIVGAMILSSAIGVYGADATLRFSWWGGEDRHKGTLDAIEEFLKAYPNIQIEAEYMGWEGYFSKLMTQVAGGAAPDIMQADYKFFPELVNQGDIFYDLNELSDKIDLSGFDKSFLAKWCTFDGKLLALPTGLNAETAIINKTFMEKMGIDPTTEWTWDLVYETGKKLHAEHPESYFLVGTMENVAGHVFSPYMKQLTGQELVKDDYTLGFDVEDATQGLTYLKKILDDGVLIPFSESAGYGMNIAENPIWVNGQAAMYLEFTTHFVVAKAAAQDQEIVGVRMPIMEDAKQTGIMVTPAQLIAINKQTKDVDAAATFVDFFFNHEDAILALGLVRSIPAARNAREVLTDAGKMDEDLARALNIGVENAGLPLSIISNNSEIIQIFQYVVELVGYGKESPEKAAEVLVTKLEEKLAELKAAAN